MSDAPAGNTGREESLARGILTNWAAFSVFVVSGFILPRLISDQLDQTSLGVWDFAWSLASYAKLLSFGIVSVAARYVARFRATGDWKSMSHVISASLALLVASACVAGVLIVVLVAAAPWLLRRTGAEINASEAQTVVGLLGATVAITLPLHLFSGILSGCRRFGLKNLNRCSWHGAALVAIVVLLHLGYGLGTVAAVLLISEVCSGLVDWVIAARLCPGLRITPRLVRMRDIREVIAFGSKAFMREMASGFLHCGTGVIVVFYLGPGLMAVYARQRALVMLSTRLLGQYASPFTPVASAHDAVGDTDALRQLLVKCTRYSLFIVLPMTVLFCVAGGSLIHIWMGKQYVETTVLIVLALGAAPMLAHRGAYRILVGMNRHAGPAAAEMIAAPIGLGLAVLCVGHLGWGLPGMALAAASAIAIGAGIVPAVLACRAVGLPLVSYVRAVLPGPVVAVLPMLGALLVAKAMLPGRPVAELGLGVGVSGLVLVPIYWNYVLPNGAKDRIRGIVRQVRAFGRKP